MNEAELPVKLNLCSAAKNLIGILKGDLFKNGCGGRSLPAASLCVFGHLVERRRNNFPSMKFTPLIVFIFSRRCNGLAKGLPRSCVCSRGSG